MIAKFLIWLDSKFEKKDGESQQEMLIISGFF